MRRFRIVLAFLLVGVVLNVAVTWACTAGFGPAFTEHSSDNDPGRYWFVNQLKYIGLTSIQSSWSSGWGRKAGRPPAALERLMPNWVPRTSPNPSLDSNVESSSIDEASGFPYLAMASRGLVRFAGDPPRVLQSEVHGLELSPFGPYGGDGQALPLRPLWPGFALNTLCYALLSVLLWLLLVQGSHRFRRLLRRRRGLCINCGYDLRGASGGGGLCPECGASGRAPRAVLDGKWR